MTILDGIPFLPAVHFTKGREAKIDTIVLHWMATTLAGCDATFTSGNRQASAHYGIEGAKIHQYVRVSHTAWHAGDRAVNHRSVGVEHSAAPGRNATPSTIATSVALCVALCRKYGISPARIFPHKKFTATACPGTLPIAAIVAAVRAQLRLAPTAPTARPTTLTLEDDMPVILHSKTNPPQHYISDLMSKRVITTPAAELAYLAAGVRVLPLPEPEIAAIRTVAPGK